MDTSVSSAFQLAAQGIQSGFQRLADNTQRIIQPAAKESQSQASSTSLEASLIDNQKIANQIQGLAKVLKTEDVLIGKLFEDWA